MPFSQLSTFYYSTNVTKAPVLSKYQGMELHDVIWSHLHFSNWNDKTDAWTTANHETATEAADKALEM